MRVYEPKKKKKLKIELLLEFWQKAIYIIP